MISRGGKWIYIHPAKTGGTSIETALAPYTDNELRPYEGTPDNSQVIYNEQDIKHARVEYFRSLLQKEIERYYIFVTVRNPWDRCVSAWLYFTRFIPSLTFNDWITLLSSRRVIAERLQKARALMVDIGYRQLVAPCVDFVRYNGAPLDLHYVRFEHLRDDFEDVCADLDLPLVELPHLLKSKREHYSEYYDNDEQCNRVARFFARDIRRFRYTFERAA